MTREEWLALGLANGVISDDVLSDTFGNAYKKWFCIKQKQIKPQSLDRIEVTFNRYFKDDDILNKKLSELGTVQLSVWLNEKLVNQGCVTHKEFSRLYQILSGVMIYAHDFNLGASLIDWGKIKRYIPSDVVMENIYSPVALSRGMVDYLTSQVVDKRVYEVKQVQCLALLMNFYLGLRIGELAAVKVSDVNTIDNVLFVHGTEVKYSDRDNEGRKTSGMKYRVSEETKTKKGTRIVPLPDKALFLYQEIQKERERLQIKSEYICSLGNDTIMTRSLERCLRKLLDECKVNRFTSHLIRKTYATWLHDSGMATKRISDLLGHAEIATTERYYLLSPTKEIRDIRNELNRIL